MEQGRDGRLVHVAHRADRRHGARGGRLYGGRGPGGGADGPPFLGSTSTRRNALVPLPDVTSATLAAAGVTLPREGIGHLWSQGDHWSGVAGAVASLSDADRAAQAIRDLMAPFYTV